jgi:uncharacterized Zn finger protein (UPF0148 family)
MMATVALACPTMGRTSDVASARPEKKRPRAATAARRARSRASARVSESVRVSSEQQERASVSRRRVWQWRRPSAQSTRLLRST